jgi:4-hydroxy-4-methyl-2-oxoglutarate aldolase
MTARPGSRTVVVTGPPRADVGDAETLGGHGVATVHEALGRVGYLGPQFRPAWPGARIGGTAVTVLCWPGDNLMIHVAVEQCRPGDVLVVATNSPSTDGLFGELFATALAHRGVRGVVLGSGVRDVAELQDMGFPAWSRAVSAQGSVKATAGAVNVPVVLGGQTIAPGDVVVADDDGVMVVPRATAQQELPQHFPAPGWVEHEPEDIWQGTLATLRGALEAGDLLKYSTLIQQLHGLIRDIAAQPVAAALVDRLQAQLVRHQFQLSLRPGRPQVSLRELTALVDAIADRDADRAEAAAVSHFRSVIAALTETTREPGGHA